MIDNDRDISWKRLLRIQSNEKNGTYQNRRKMFFSLIKDPLFDQNDIADSLQKICDRDVAGITDWRKYFITVPEIMDSLHKYTDGRASERYVRFEGKYIFLMGSTRLYGWTLRRKKSSLKVKNYSKRKEQNPKNRINVGFYFSDFFFGKLFAVF